jgi:NTP pyrophosphatase (non-canonical NTP hydrolase)
VKKVLRDRDGDFSDEQVAAIKDELGDVLWYIAALSSDLGLSLGDIASGNIEKLRSRLERGAIQGDGDKR